MPFGGSKLDDLTIIGKNGLLKANGVNPISNATAVDITATLGYTPANLLDVTNASNLSSGTIAKERLPVLTANDVGALAPTGNGSALTGLTLSQITAALGYTPVNKAGDTMTGGLKINYPDARLGVGTNNPLGFTGNGWVTINGSSYSALSFSANDLEKTRLSNTGDAFRYNNTTNVPHIFGVNGVEAFRIYSDSVFVGGDSTGGVPYARVTRNASTGTLGQDVYRINDKNVFNVYASATQYVWDAYTASTGGYAGNVLSANNATQVVNFAKTPTANSVPLLVKNDLGYVTPAMYGAVGDGLTDDTSALSAALNSGMPVQLSGYYKITSLINVDISVAGGLFVRGSGDLSQILLGSPSAGIAIATGSYGNPIGKRGKVVIHNFSIVPIIANHTGWGLEIDGSAQSGSASPMFDIYGVDFNPVDKNSWIGNGLLLKDVRYGQITNSHFFGKYGADNTYLGVSAQVYSSVANSAPCNIKFTDCSAAWFYKCVESKPFGSSSGQSDPEGIYIKSFDMLACQFGVYSNSTDITSDGLIVSDCDISFAQCGIYAQNIQRPNFHDNYLLSIALSGAGSQSDGIYTAMTNGQPNNGFIHHNIIDFQNTTGTYATRIGIYAANSSGSLLAKIDDNMTRGATTPYTIVNNVGGTSNNNISS